MHAVLCAVAGLFIAAALFVLLAWGIMRCIRRDCDE